MKKTIKSLLLINLLLILFIVPIKAAKTDDFIWLDKAQTQLKGIIEDVEITFTNIESENDSTRKFSKITNCAPNSQDICTYQVVFNKPAYEKGYLHKYKDGVDLFGNVQINVDIKPFGWTPPSTNTGSNPTNSNSNLGYQDPDNACINTIFGCFDRNEQALTKFLGAAFAWSAGVIGTMAMLGLIYAGYAYVTSGGNPDNISKAKDIIITSLSALLIIIFAYAFFKLLGVGI